jgi:hypothetical protein
MTSEEKKESHKLAMLKYRGKNKEKIKEQSKIYYENNKEKILD